MNGVSFNQRVVRNMTRKQQSQCWQAMQSWRNVQHESDVSKPTGTRKRNPKRKKHEGDGGTV